MLIREVKLVMRKEETYTIIVHHTGHEDQIRHGVDKLNATVIPAELKMAFPKAFKSGTMSVEVIKE